MKTRNTKSKSISIRTNEVRTNGQKTITKTTTNRTGKQVLTAEGWQDVK